MTFDQSKADLSKPLTLIDYMYKYKAINEDEIQKILEHLLEDLETKRRPTTIK